MVPSTDSGHASLSSLPGELLTHIISFLPGSEFGRELDARAPVFVDHRNLAPLLTVNRGWREVVEERIYTNGVSLEGVKELALFERSIRGGSRSAAGRLTKSIMIDLAGPYRRSSDHYDLSTDHDVRERLASFIPKLLAACDRLEHIFLLNFRRHILEDEFLLRHFRRLRRFTLGVDDECRSPTFLLNQLDEVWSGNSSITQASLYGMAVRCPVIYRGRRHFRLPSPLTSLTLDKCSFTLDAIPPFSHPTFSPLLKTLRLIDCCIFYPRTKTDLDSVVSPVASQLLHFEMTLRLKFSRFAPQPAPLGTADPSTLLDPPSALCRMVELMGSLESLRLDCPTLCGRRIESVLPGSLVSLEVRGFPDADGLSPTQT